MDTHKEIKKLKKQITDTEKQIGIKQNYITQLQRELQEMKNENGKRKSVLYNLTHAQIQVTDHAVLRSIERKAGIDVDGLRKQIGDSLTPPANGKYPLLPGLRTVVKNNIVVTVEPV